MTAVRALAKSSRSISNFTLPFVNSVTNVFTKMVKVNVRADEPHNKTAGEPARDVSAILGLSGDVVGVVVVSFDLPVAAKIIESFASAAIDPASPEFADAVGELANMIVGGAKKDFGMTVNITVPSVIIGPGHHVAHVRNTSCLVIPCHTPAGDFVIEVSIKKTLDGPRLNP